MIVVDGLEITPEHKELANALYKRYEALAVKSVAKQFGSYKTASVVAANNNMEIDDLVNVAKMTLWIICIKDPHDRPGLVQYISQTVRWRVSDYVHEKGTPFKVTRWTSVEERNSITISSTNEKSGDDSTSVEKGELIINEDYILEDEAITNADFKLSLETLNEKERFIIEKKLLDLQDAEIGKLMGITRQVVHKHKMRGYAKIRAFYNNEEYVAKKVR